jgi:hypothetical protein
VVLVGAGVLIYGATRPHPLDTHLGVLNLP